jgi:hypothetical protein
MAANLVPGLSARCIPASALSRSGMHQRQPANGGIERFGLQFEQASIH